ncbi:lipopolysaccharide biosynthesis protein [Rhodopseudomonas palustris]|uniref:Lipopolysaccharide biosynthesis protein n=1 Tax=Rhodopseudomonas palustris TaxID=1076 RepID=A0A323UC10_RHOPL|nr:exopolysaccharide transport family protein [Rhodopseudomonas palustris]PZA10385.1 lipopolysaccharide biosynthesis protein [Rhodopseudomonas palustris]
MSGSQPGRDKAIPVTRPTADIWEDPDQLPSGRSDLIKAKLTPAVVTKFLRENLKRIAALAGVLFVLGMLGLWLVPIRYAATALVIVDPREQRVTTDQEVLPGIGQDAAALQSLIEIAKSDGFLKPLVEKLKVAEDREIAGSETDPARVLDRFRKHLEIARRGLTYVIEMTFVAKDPQRAAYYANAVAEAFVASQTKVRTIAADEAAAWLNNRLKTLNQTLRASEDAVAAFKTQYRIVDAGRESTTRQLRVTELTQQVSAARLRTEEAKNRYEQAQRDLKSDVDGSTGSKSDLVSVLRTQRTQLNDQIAQKRAVLGDRHPELVIAYNQLAELNRQIEAERKRNLASAKSDYQAMLDQQKALEQQLKSLESEMLGDDQASVKLKELQREANANRAIYEQFLERYNATNQQRLLQATQTKVASFATPPTRPTRPPLLVLIAAIAVASVLVSIAITAIMASMAQRAAPADDSNPPDDATAAAPAEAMPAPTPVPVPAKDTKPAADDASLPIVARIPDLAGVRTLGGKLAMLGGERRLDHYVIGLLDAVGVKPSQRGKVVLVTSVNAGAGKSSVARALNAIAIDRGLLSVVIEVAGQSRTAPAGRSEPSSGAQVRVLKTTIPSVLRLIGPVPDASAQSDVRSEFDLILIDAPALDQQPEVAEIAAHADLSLLVVDRTVTEAGAALEAQALLSRRGRTPVGVVINRASAHQASAAATSAARLAS